MPRKEKVPTLQNEGTRLQKADSIATTNRRTTAGASITTC
jgi:hypothetical protein